MLDEQGDQQSPDTSIAVQERMDGLELDVSQADAHQRGQLIAAMNPFLQRRQCIGQSIRGRRHEAGVAGSAAADPVLAATNFAGLFLTAASALHQSLVGLAEQSGRQRKSLGPGEFLASVGQGVDVVADYTHIVGALGLLSGFKGEHVLERRLRALDLGGDQASLRTKP